MHLIQKNSTEHQVSEIKRYERRAMNLDNIPTYLKDHVHWCTFRKKMRKGSEKKVQCNAVTGNKAFETFTDFGTAIEHLEELTD